MLAIGPRGFKRGSDVEWEVIGVVDGEKFERDEEEKGRRER